MNSSMSFLDALLLDAHRINVWVAKRSDRNKGSGTQSDPYNANTDLDAELFDQVMESLPETTPLRVHLGPGEYLTKGYADGVSGGWQPKPGMKLVGSGIDVTTLKLTGTQDPGSGARHYYLLGHALGSGNPLMDFFEVSDLTLNCDTASQSASNIACGGLRLMGQQATVRRVKVIKWGTKTSQQPCYAMALILADPSWTTAQVAHSGFEECLALDPYGSMPAGVPIHVFYVGPKSQPGASLEGEGISPFIRYCYADGSGLSLDLDIRALTMAWCRNGIVEANQVHHVGVAGPMIENATAWSMTIRNNSFHDVRRGPYLKLGQASGTAIGLADLTFSGGSPPYEITATVDDDHNLKVGDRATLECVPSSLSGLVEVSEVVDATHFKYYWPGASGTLSSGSIKKVFGTGHVLIEGNLIELAPGEDGEQAIEIDDAQFGFQSPDYVHGEVLIRNNLIRYVDNAFDLDFDGDGILVSGARSLNVRENVVEVALADPIHNERCGVVEYFDNRTPSGGLLPRADPITGKAIEELDAAAEDALIAALFEKH